MNDTEAREKFALSGQCDNAAHFACPYPARCKCKCHAVSPAVTGDEEAIAREIIKAMVWPTDRSLPSEHCLCESAMCEHWQKEAVDAIAAALRSHHPNPQPTKENDE